MSTDATRVPRCERWNLVGGSRGRPDRVGKDVGRMIRRRLYLASWRLDSRAPAASSPTTVFGCLAGYRRVDGPFRCDCTSTTICAPGTTGELASGGQDRGNRASARACLSVIGSVEVSPGEGG